jgi:hypothetical protein
MSTREPPREFLRFVYIIIMINPMYIIYLFIYMYRRNFINLLISFCNK